MEVDVEQMPNFLIDKMMVVRGGWEGGGSGLEIVFSSLFTEHIQATLNHKLLHLIDIFITCTSGGPVSFLINKRWLCPS